MSNFKLFLNSFIVSLFVFGAPVATTQMVLASTENSVSIDQLVMSRCGTQYVYASGAATYGPIASHLLVDFDGVHAFNLAKQENWTTGLIELNPGDHVVTARIHNTDGSVTDTAKKLTVPECPKEDAGPGDEQDCCPGPDPVVSEPRQAAKPRVKGATTKAVGPVTLAELRPLNEVFYSVFGRIPVFAEWKYWADRYSTDKRDWGAIFGAMQWHKERGRTIGK